MQHQVTNIATNQDRKNSDSPSLDPCQMDGNTTSAFPEETGYAMVFFPDSSLWRHEFEAEMGSHFTYNYLTIVFIRKSAELRSLHLKFKIELLKKQTEP